MSQPVLSNFLIKSADLDCFPPHYKNSITTLLHTRFQVTELAVTVPDSSGSNFHGTKSGFDRSTDRPTDREKDRPFLRYSTACTHRLTRPKKRYWTQLDSRLELRQKGSAFDLSVSGDALRRRQQQQGTHHVTDGVR